MTNKKKRIIVTGASGFLGSWVCRVLSEFHEVTALVRSGSSTKRLNGIKGLQIISTSQKSWAEQINKIGPEAYISLEWTGVGNKDRNELFQNENVLRTEQLLDNLKPIPVIIGTGSQAELGSVSDFISESQPDSPTTEYGKSKVQARMLFSSSAERNGARWAWARVFSTYGPLDSNEWLIPATMKSLVEGREMLLTKGEQEWSYLHVYDLALAYKKIIEADSISGVVNVGNPNTIQIRDVVEKISKITGNSNLLKFGEIPYRSDQVMKLAPICEKLTQNGWAPKVDIDSGLAHLYKWLINRTNSELQLIDGSKISFSLPATS